MPPVAQACAWLRWLERRMPLEERYVSIFLPVVTSAPAARLTVIARAPVPGDFQLLADKLEAPAYVDDLSKLAPRANGDAPADANEPPAEIPGGSWLEFVER